MGHKSQVQTLKLADRKSFSAQSIRTKRNKPTRLRVASESELHFNELNQHEGTTVNVLSELNEMERPPQCK